MTTHFDSCGRALADIAPPMRGYVELTAEGCERIAHLSTWQEAEVTLIQVVNCVCSSGDVDICRLTWGGTYEFSHWSEVEG